MGAQLIKGTDINKETFGVGGQSNQWTMHKGQKQDPTKKKVCVFLFDKKNQTQTFIDQIKKEPQSLIKYKHPSILKIQESLIENQKMMGYVTEEFETTLQIAMKENKQVCESLLELKLNFISLLQILNFLHYTLKLGHFNLSPSNIYIMPDGSWKIGGFQFSSQILENSTQIQNIDHSQKLTPNLNFAAPEVVNQNRGYFQSDLFSLGLIFMQLSKHMYDKGKYDPIFNITDQQSYKDAIQKMGPYLQKEPFFQNMDNELKQILTQMLSYKPEKRPLVSELLHSKLLQDPFVKAYQHLETINNIQPQQQPGFLRGLYQLLNKYPEKIMKNRIIPRIMKLFLYPFLIVPLLEICVKLQQTLTKSEFNQIVWPSIKQLCQSKEIPGQALYILVQNIDEFFQIVGKQEIQTTILPLFLKCLQLPAPKLQEIALAKVQFIINNWDYNQYTKSVVIPKLIQIISNEKSTLEINKTTLSLFKDILKFMDKTTINEKLVPALDKLKKSKNDLELRMSLLQIYQIISKDLEINVIAGNIIPQLLPFLTDFDLKKNEYQQYSKTIKELLQRVDDERLKQLPEENDQFNFDQIANKTNIQQIQEKANSSNSLIKNNNTNTNINNDFDFLDELNSQQSQPINNNQANQQLQQQNQYQTQTQTQNQNSVFDNNDDFFANSSTNGNSNLGKNSNFNSNQIKSTNQVQEDPFFADFNNEQNNNFNKNTINNSKSLDQNEDPFFKNFDVQKKENKTQNQQSDPFFSQFNIQQNSKNQNQQKTDPFFEDFDFNTNKNNKNLKQSNNISENSQFQQNTNNFNNFSNTQKQNYNKSSQFEDDPFAELSQNNTNQMPTGMIDLSKNYSNSTNNSQSFNQLSNNSQSQNQTQNQNQNQKDNPFQNLQNPPKTGSKLFSKMNIKPPQKAHKQSSQQQVQYQQQNNQNNMEWDFNSNSNINTNTNNNNNIDNKQNKQKNDDPFDFL